MKRTWDARLLLLETASVGLSTDHTYTLHLQLDVSRSDTAGMRNCTTSPVLRFHLSKLSDDRVREDMCAAFDDRPRSQGLLSISVVGPAALDRRLVSIVQSLCRRFLGQGNSSGVAAETRKRIPAGRQDPAVSTLLYKSAAVESRENRVILPSERGRSMGLSALQEISKSLSKRYAGLPLGDIDLLQVSDHPSIALSDADVVRGIGRQNGSKACGLDGIHMRVIKVLLQSSYPAVLCRLFNLCLSTGSSTLSWDSTNIHMVTKDPGKPRDADNVRPITLIYAPKIVRKTLAGAFLR